jgi:hypothetical protein
MSHDTAAWRHAEVWVGEALVLVKIRYREWRMKSPPPVPVCDLIVTVRDRPELLWSAHRTMDIGRIFALKTRIEQYLTRVAGKYTVEQLFEKKSKPACLQQLIESFNSDTTHRNGKKKVSDSLPAEVRAHCCAVS